MDRLQDLPQRIEQYCQQGRLALRKAIRVWTVEQSGQPLS